MPGQAPRPGEHPGQPIFLEKQPQIDSGVCEKNDARQFSSRTALGASRALDFNVVMGRTPRIDTKRHFFRTSVHSPFSLLSATMKSGARGAPAPYFRLGVIFFANTGIKKRGVAVVGRTQVRQISGRPSPAHPSWAQTTPAGPAGPDPEPAGSGQTRRR